MIRYLTRAHVIDLHLRVAQESGGPTGLLSLEALESAVRQPLQTFGGQELYPDISDKASILGFSIILGHPFVDGNKRTGHAALETFLLLNGYEIDASVNDQELTILKVAAGEMNREQFSEWLSARIRRVEPES